MSITPQSSRSGDDTAYTPNWIKMDTDLAWDDELAPLGDEDLYPELDPNEDLDYINREKMRY